MGSLRARRMRHGRPHEHRDRAVDSGRGRGKALRAHQGAARHRRSPGAIIEAMSTYIRPAWLVGSHLQTIYPALLRRPSVTLRRQRIDTPDGDFIDLDWLDSPSSRDGAPLVVLFHGLEGNSSSHYARSLLQHLFDIGWRG